MKTFGELVEEQNLTESEAYQCYVYLIAMRLSKINQEEFYNAIFTMKKIFK